MELPIRLREEITVMPGTAFGLYRPIAALKLEMLQNAHKELAIFKQLFDQMLPEDRFGQFPNAATDEDFLKSLLKLVKTILQESKQPVFRDAVVTKVAQKGQKSLYRVVVPYFDFKSLNNVLNWLFKEVQTALLDCSDLKLEEEKRSKQLQQLIEAGRQKGIQGLNTFHFLKAADELNISTSRAVGNYFWFGTGSQAQLLKSSFTEKTSVVGVGLARDKLLTSQFLHSLGLPTAKSIKVRTIDEAAVAAEKLGYPVAIKPVDQDGGYGVQAYLKTEQSVRLAFQEAVSNSPHVMVEEHCSGVEYRVTVFKQNIIKIITRTPASVSGDGLQTISELITAFNNEAAQLKRAWNHGGKALIELNQEALDLLEEQGLKPEDIPEKNRKVALRRSANVSTGGTPSLYTGKVHPDNHQLFLRAAQSLHLELAGIDIIMTDMAVSWLESRANILEVNAMPQLGADLTPSIYKDVLKQLLPNDPHIKLSVIIGSPDINRCYMGVKSRIEQSDSASFGFASTEGIYVGQEQRCRQPTSAFSAIETLLKQRDVDRAVVCLPFEEVIRYGLPFNQCDLVVFDLVPNKEHLTYLQSLEHFLKPQCTGKILFHSSYAEHLATNKNDMNITFADSEKLVTHALELMAN